MAGAPEDAYMSLYRKVIRKRLGKDVKEVPLGLRVTDDDGFKIIVMRPSEGDPEYLRLAAYFNRPDEPVTRLKDVALAVAGRCKALKVEVADDAIILRVECFNSAPDTLPSAHHLAGTLPRMLSALRYGWRAFREELVLAEYAAELADIDVDTSE